MSVLTVYDTYGLAIALLFLDHLRFLCTNSVFKKEARAYLTGCLVAVGQDHHSRQARTEKPEAMFQMIAERLGKMEEEQPQTIMSNGEWTSSFVFPLEIVVMITDSLRLSKQVSQIVRRIRESIIPSVKEASGWSGVCRVELQDTRSTRKASGIHTHMIYNAV